MNSEPFLSDPRRYFHGAYELFCKFGGPSVYFHQECLRAGQAEFLSRRHIEMLYATLASWGMHRMGDSKTKLTDWECFSGSIWNQREQLEQFRVYRMTDLSEAEYEQAVRSLKSIYEALHASVSDATMVANSKALFHLFPEFILNRPGFSGELRV